MTFTFWFTLTIGAVVVLILVAAILIAIKCETQRIIRGRRASKPVGRVNEARQVLDRAADLKFPTHRKEQS